MDTLLVPWGTVADKKNKYEAIMQNISTHLLMLLLCVATSPDPIMESTSVGRWPKAASIMELGGR